VQTTPLAACELKRKLTTALLSGAFVSLAAPVFAAEGGGNQSIGEMILHMGWPVANFIIFVGVIYYFDNGPMKEYLATRSATIRKDLLEAAEIKAAATALLEDQGRKLIISALRLLHAQHIGLHQIEPARHARHAREDRVYIPGCDKHFLPQIYADKRRLIF
jgi:hypothetical protein